MSLKYALLGLLAHTPRHGYELMAAFEATFSDLGQLRAGQLYPLLARLNTAGLVTVQTVAQTRSPARKVYQLTAEGQQSLLEWLAEPVEVGLEPSRNNFFVKLLVHALLIGSQTAAADSRAMLARQRRQFEQTIADLKQRRLQQTMITGPGAADPRSAAQQEQSEVQLLLLEGTLLHLEADLQWLNLLESRLTRLLTARTANHQEQETGHE